MNIKVCDWQAVEAAMFERARKVPYGVKDYHPVRALIFFDPCLSHWPDRSFSPASRCYRISSADKFWHEECSGTSLSGFCMDPDDRDSKGILLNYYMFADNDPWVVDFCILIEG